MRVSGCELEGRRDDLGQVEHEMEKEEMRDKGQRKIKRVKSGKKKKKKEKG